jgi:microcin C transport system ATP-binding protein
MPLILEKSGAEFMTPSIVQVRNLSVNFKTSESTVTAVDDISFDIPKGKTLALVGESGSGKSVTALSLLQLLPYPTAEHSDTSSIIYKEQQLVGASNSFLRKVRGNNISMIFQEPMTSLNPLHNIEKQIREVMLIHQGFSVKQAREKTIHLLHLVGLDDFEDRLGAYPHQLSGGQRQRVMIAMALANTPDLLIADEPTTALDVTIQAQILELLRSLQKKLGMSLLLITHDLGIVQHIADEVCVMQHGKIVESQSTRVLFSKPSHEYTKALLAAEPEGTALAVPADAQTVLRANNVRVWFPIKKGVLRKTVDYIKAADDISLSVRAGETLAIVGESGSGKTTLALALLRLVASKGEIILDKTSLHDLKSHSLKPLRQQMQVIFQDPFGSLNPRMTINQIIGEGLNAHKMMTDPHQRSQQIVEILESVGLNPESRFRYPHEFSGGQRQRIAIARSLIMKPKLLILDEPTSALDRSVQKQIISLLKDLQSRYKLAYIFISHDLKVVKTISNQIIVMRQGKLVEHGTTDQIFNTPQQEYTKSLISAALSFRTS